jgi:hypothetical protein
VRYALCLLTSPGRDECLQRTLKSFEDRVVPKPTELRAYCDGPVDIPKMYDGMVPWDISGARRQGGFCRATRNLWKHAARSEEPWLVWLEDDFELVRSLDLRDLANVMVQEPQLAQMALLRQPCNEDEEAAGGYMLQHPEEYTRRGGGSAAWWEHRHHWTTNVSLFRTEIPQRYEWPDGPFCEGMFGFRIREQRPETTFGVWGAEANVPWTMHIGQRIGTGY